MTNQKMSLGEKVAIGVAVAGLAGLVGGMTLIMSNMRKSQTYTFTNKEYVIKSKIDELNSQKLLVEDQRLLEKYLSFKEDYVRDLEHKLEETRANPLYAVEQQKRKEDEKSDEQAGKVMLFSTLLYAAGMFYGIRKLRERTRAESQTSGASK